MYVCSYIGAAVVVDPTAADRQTQKSDITIAPSTTPDSDNQETHNGADRTMTRASEAIEELKQWSVV